MSVFINIQCFFTQPSRDTIVYGEKLKWVVPDHVGTRTTNARNGKAKGCARASNTENTCRLYVLSLVNSVKVSELIKVFCLSFFLRIGAGWIDGSLYIGCLEKYKSSLNNHHKLFSNPIRATPQLITS